MEDPTFLPTAATTATTTGEGNPVSSVTNNISDEGDDEDDEFGEFADAVTSTQEGDSTTNGIQVVEADAEDYSNNSDTSIGLEEYEDAVDDEGAAVAAAQLPIEIDKVPSITTTTTMMDNIASTTDEFMKLSDESLGDSVDPVVVAAAAMAMASATKDSGGTATSTIAAATTATVSCSSRTEEGADDNNNNSRDTVVPAASAVTRNDKLQPHQQQLQWSYSDDATTSYKGVHDDDVVVGGLDTTTGNAFPVNAATDVDIDDELGDGVHDGKMASATAPASPDISIPVKIQDNDDFGDFDSANPAVKGVADAKAAVFEAEVIANGDEDDFGDFGDAVPPVEEAASTKAAAAPEDDDDDFGDFGDASPPIGEIANAATADEEDFGDFGGAQIVPLHPEDDDDNDFGDFDGGDFGAEAPSASLNVDEDDFGNFDKAPTESSAAAQLTVFPDSGGDPILDKLRLVFPKLFARYNDIPDGGDDESVTDKDETVGDTSSPVHDIAVTVQSVLVSCFLLDDSLLLYFYSRYTCWNADRHPSSHKQ